MQRRIHSRKDLEPLRKRLRNNSTSADAVLWQLLKNRQVDGIRFKRQHSVGHYVLDFYCAKERLAIELDGEHHYTNEGLKRDDARTNYLTKLNIKVLRFENNEVFQNPEAVIKKIRMYMNK